MSVDDTTCDDVAQAQTMAAASEAYCSLCEGSFPAGTTACPNDGTRLVQFADQHVRLLGKLIDGRFEVLSKLGQGGMGDVYLARQKSVGREVAIKVIKAELSADRVASKRFLREAKLLSRVSHPNVVVVHDMGQDGDGTLYLVMELVTGRTLAELLRDDPQMPAERIRDISLQVCDALEAAHGKGVIHRDLKPSNILVSTSASGRDTVKVLDFGLAKSLAGDDTAGDITSTGVIMGTPLYVSPEMITGDEVDGRSDLYSLGCLLYEMCSGEPPFMAETATLLLSKHIAEKPAPIQRDDVADLYSVTLSLLRKTPNDRPADAAAVSRLISGVDGAVPTPIPDAPAPRPSAVLATADTKDAGAHITEVVAPATKKQNLAKIWVPMFGLAAVAIAVALVLMGGEEDAASSPEVASSVLPLDAAPKEATRAPVVVEFDASVATVSLTIDSKPSADEVVLDGKSLGPGPATVTIPASPQAHVLEFHKSGYAPRITSLAATRDVVRTDFALVKLSRSSRRKTHKGRKGKQDVRPEKKPDTATKADTKTSPAPDTKPKVNYFDN